MTAIERQSLRFASVRPLIRYVDEDQAVIESHIRLHRPLTLAETAPLPLPRVADVYFEVRGSDGFVDEGCVTLILIDGESVLRLQIVRPHRWWPAGMGEQPLYTVSLSLLDGRRIIDRHACSVGLTSVRPKQPEAGLASLLINGQEYDVEQVVNVDAPNENQFIPVTGGCLLVIRGHYGPDVLYEAADRAGIMMLQCIPLDPMGHPENEVDAHIDRLAGHPSLIGWFVGHLGPVTDVVKSRIAQRDPTHPVYNGLPNHTAA